ncbi:MAG: malonic semialdehyde reductase [Pseudomonadota bacterium]
MSTALDSHALAQAFTNARTFNNFKDKEVSDETIAQLYDLMKWGPTSMNCQPGHYVVVKSAEAKARLMPTLMPGNQEKTNAAPATIIVASDTRFFEDMGEKFPAMDVKGMFAADPALTERTAFRNGTLQGAYLIIAARMLGLDCGPMSGFNNQALDEEFFPDGRYVSNFLINVGYGDASGNYPRGSRLPFDEAVSII